MNVIDARELGDEMQELNDRQQDEDAIDPLDEDDEARLAALVELFDEIGESAARDGATLIPESDFEEYAQELAEELDLIPENAAWPSNCIDWEQAARELSQDYSTVEFDGESYYYQAR